MDEPEPGPGPGIIRDVLLTHFGVKGMHWGVRRNRSGSMAPSEDASRAQAVKTKFKTGGKESLSNKEMQDYINRVNLERQFKTLQPSGVATKFISELLTGVGKQQATKVVNDAVSKQVGNALKK